jgi:hypothetical protein
MTIVPQPGERTMAPNRSNWMQANVPQKIENCAARSQSNAQSMQ